MIDARVALTECLMTIRLRIADDPEPVQEGREGLPVVINEEGIDVVGAATTAIDVVGLASMRKQR